jgi:subtilisin family serine protease
MFPARYPEVIAVGASNAYGELAGFSNAGPEMDLMAPGVDVVSLDITNGDLSKGFGIASGTSMAAPYVTAAAAMMKALAPMLDNEAIQQILVKFSSYIGQENVGELDLETAIDAVLNWILDKDPSVLSRSEMKEIYKESLVEKINQSGEVLWQ